MSLSERERFLYHLSVLKKMDTVKNEIDIDVDEMLYAIWKNRCRSLTESDIKSIYMEVEEEAMNGTSVYEEFTARVTYNKDEDKNDEYR